MSYQSIKFIDQKDSKNRPILSLCRYNQDGNEIKDFYVKFYRTSSEIIGLFNEYICGQLANKCNLNIPEFDYITIGNHVLDDKRLDKFRNLERVFPGQTAFGSKVMQNTIELSALSADISKIGFNKLAEPIHLFRIALFDLWTGNKDRTQNHFNLLITQTKKQKLVVIDHFEAFYGLSDKEELILSPERIDIWNTIVGSQYALNMFSYLSRDIRKQEIQLFREIATNLDVRGLISTCFENKPSDWDLNEETVDFMIRFLTDDERISKIFEEAEHLIYV